MSHKPRVLLTSRVFGPEEIGANEKISKEIRIQIKNLWESLTSLADLTIFNGRFPDDDQIKALIKSSNPNIIGCHLSHNLTSEMLENPDIFALSTSTAGFNHINRCPEDDILITHTPGVLHDTVADYSVALIMANLRNIIDLHNYVWNESWTTKDKWDLDQSLSSIIKNKILGIVGLGEIGKEIVRHLYPWGIKILYYDINRNVEFEDKFKNIEFKENLQELFKEADIISINVPLNAHTENLISWDLLKLMKKGSLLINTARGPILDINALLDLLEQRVIQINIALDVFPIEPLDPNTLERLRKIKQEIPEIRMILMPHNASADADTRGKMVIIFLEDIIKIIESSGPEDLDGVRIIPEHRKQLSEKKWRIHKYWESK